MAAMFKLLIALCLFVSLSSFSDAQTCSSFTFSSNKAFETCKDLPTLNAFLHWTFDQSTGKLQMAYRIKPTSTTNWVAWAIQPTLTTTKPMAGAQALVALQSGGAVSEVRTVPIPTGAAAYGTVLANGTLTGYTVTDIKGEVQSGEVIISATWTLPANTTTILQVWQEGPVDNTGTPSSHPSSSANLNAAGTLDLLSGQSTSSGGAGSTLKKRNIHAVLNVVSWGILMPFGAMVARYLKTFKAADPAWFYLHAGCQTSAYIVGVAGWATGIKLGSDSVGIQYDTHRNIGITLFCLGTLQVFALLLRPNKDHKFRFYWNIYHHLTGYLVIILSIVNIFEGFDILKPNKKWKNSYIGLIIALAVQAGLLEAYTWYVVLKRKKAEKAPHGANGVNGYGA